MSTTMLGRLSSIGRIVVLQRNICLGTIIRGRHQTESARAEILGMTIVLKYNIKLYDIHT